MRIQLSSYEESSLIYLAILLGFIFAITVGVTVATIGLLTDLHIESLLVGRVLPLGAMSTGAVAILGYLFFLQTFKLPLKKLNIIITILISFVGYLSISLTMFFTLIPHEYHNIWGFIIFKHMEITSASLSSIAKYKKTIIELGSWAYWYELLIIIGFISGALATRVYLFSLSYCESCSIFRRKNPDQSHRYFDDSEQGMKQWQQIKECPSADEKKKIHDEMFASSVEGKYDVFVISVDVYVCQECLSREYRFTVSEKIGGKWLTNLELTCNTIESGFHDNPSAHRANV